MDPAIAKSLGISQRATEASFATPAPQTSAQTLVANDFYKSMHMPTVAASGMEAITSFHAAAIAAIEQETKAAVSALGKVDPDLKSTVRTARVAGIARMAMAALQERLANLATPVVKTVEAARARVDEAMNRRPADPLDAIVWFAKVADMRRQVEHLLTTDREEAFKAAFTLAQRGDETFPEVFLNSVSIVLPEEVASRLTREYLHAFAPVQAAWLEAAEEGFQEVQTIVNCAELAITAAFNQTGVPLDWTALGQKAIIEAWPASTKGNFVAARGESVYTELLQNRVDLSAAVTFFRPGLTPKDSGTSLPSQDPLPGLDWRLLI